MIIWGTRGREIELSSGQFHCPKCDYLNEEISANDMLNGNAECGMCETEFKVEGLDGIKITATIE